MKFVQDPDNADHFPLAITEDVKTSTLVEKLKFIAQRVTVIKGLTLEAYKDA